MRRLFFSVVVTAFIFTLNHGYCENATEANATLVPAEKISAVEAAANAAAEKEKIKKEKAEAAERARQAAAAAAALAKKTALEPGIKQKLKAKVWTIYVIPSGPNSANKPIVVGNFTFTDLSVDSEFMDSLGFALSNYALNPRDDGSADWETMQRTANNSIAYIRGELRVDGNMTGAMGIHPPKGDKEEYRFTTVAPAGPVQPVKKPEAAEEVKEGAGAGVKEEAPAKEPAKTPVNQTEN